MKEILNEIRVIAQSYPNIEKVVLFGSRARGENSPRSDIDLAVYANGDICDFVENLELHVNTLLQFDITHMNDKLDSYFVEQIIKEGITVYEKH